MKIKNEEQLKQELTKIKENDWIIPNHIDPYNLSIIMLDNIGTVDYILRDKLILNMFYRIIDSSKISHEQMKHILELCLSEKHLFNGLGKSKDDSVFNRTFTVLIIESILSKNNAEKEFLSELELMNIYKKVMEYFRKEKDFRGYVEEKGWAHATAHASDTLCALSQSKYLKHKEHMEILAFIKEKVCVPSYTYINEEDERMINVFMSIYNSNTISTDEMINWIASFGDVNANGKYPDEEHLRENRKVFFRSLYFRAQKFHLEEGIIKAIGDILNRLPKFYE